MTQTQDAVARIKALVGTEMPAVEATIEAGHLRRFLAAIGDASPRWQEEAPPTFLAAVGGDTPQIPEFLDYGSGWLNAGDRFDYFEPIRVGDRITSRTRLQDVYEKQGGSGSLLFLVFVTEHWNQHARLVARVTGTRIRR
jgi:N-terminal half of MaoC dehydratase